jgi:hypothetical protein
MLIGPFAGKHSREAEKVAAIKAWVREGFDFPDQPIFVTQLNCTEPGCPDLETVIAVLAEGGPPVQFRLYKSITDITRDDITALAEHPEQFPKTG